MNKDNVFIKLILPVITCFLSIISVVIGIVALTKAYKSPQITGIGNLSDKMYDTVADYISVYTYGKGHQITDKEVIEEIQNDIVNILQYAACTPANNKSFDSRFESITFGWYTGTGNPATEDGYYSEGFQIAVMEDSRLCFANTIGGSKDSNKFFYYSDCIVELHAAVRSTINLAFGDEIIV